ncbi:sodium:proton exchanger [Paenarthrobacter nicotinovorans]|uniref:sodium/calcium exchanger protein n=1 Tax=Paenarthrobacter nicotinovorans TaxID=29320 RepID=UPI001C92FA03|nr:sodium:proton exchanger [Paenarthrobacter nicotinovorans]
MKRAGSLGAIAGGLALPVAVMVPGVLLQLSGLHVPPVAAASAFAAAVVGAAFLLTWGTELAEIDLGEGLALALLALIAVLPEYAVDVVFAAKAGRDPAAYAPLALANMTGANRLLIGVGWSVVALVALVALRRKGQGLTAESRPEAVELAPVQVIELAFLTVASVYALTLPLRDSLTIVDTVVLFGIFAVYLWRLRPSASPMEPKFGHSVGEGGEEDDEESELFGPAKRIALLSFRRRRLLTVGMLAAAAAVIIVVAEPFADSLVQTGRQLNVSEFLLVQWVAPLASETPEFIAVVLLAWKLQSAAALGALISSKINQWTLLVGILPLVFAFSAGSLKGLPVDSVQREELLLTAAQSMFAVGLVIGGRLTRAGAWSLLGLFFAQFVAAWTLPPDLRGAERLIVAAVYLVLAAGLLIRRRRSLLNVLRAGLGRSAPTKVAGEPPTP